VLSRTRVAKSLQKRPRRCRAAPGTPLGDPGRTGWSRNSSRDQLAIHLTQSHLPKLADHGVVEQHQDRGTIKYRPDEGIEAVLDGLPEEPSLINS
jgi:hypothetical protein